MSTLPSISPWYNKYHEEIHDLTAGVVGGCSGILVGSPFDLVKTRLQAGTAVGSPFSTAKLILQREGPLAFWKGIMPPIVSNVPINAIGFATYGNMKRTLTNVFDPPSTSPDRPKQLFNPTPMTYKSDFYSKELFQRYNLPTSFSNQFQSTTTPSQLQLERFESHSSISENPGVPSWLAVFLAGCWSGFLSCSFSTPAELLKIQEQNITGKTPPILQTIKSMVSAHGPASVYRGFWATVARDAPSVGVYFCSYEMVKWYLRDETWTPQVVVDGKVITPEESQSMFSSSDQNHDIKINWQHDIQYSFWVPLIGGSVAGPLSWMATYPVDVVKTRLQSMSYEEYKRTSMFQCAKDIVKAQGWRFFTTGLGTTILRAIPVNAVTFLLYEKSLELCKKYHSSQQIMSRQ